jgi:hypothetical protein
MGILRGSRQTGSGSWSPERRGVRTAVRPDRDLDDETLGRCEAQAIVGRVAAADPYAAWLARREADRRQRAQPETRWVYRQHRPAGSSGSAIVAGTREARDDRGSGSPHDGLVTAA